MKKISNFIRALFSARRIAEEAEREQKRMATRIEAIMHNLPGMVFQQLYNPPEYTYTFVSEGCKELIGYSAEELMGDGAINIFDITHPDDIEPIEKLSAETLPFGLPFEIIFRVRTKDGAIKWLWERSRVIEKNPDGTPHLIEGYYADVTERQQLEAAERGQKQMASRIEAIINNLPGMAYQSLCVFPSYPLTFVSEGSKDLIGYTPEELVGKANQFMAMVHPDDLPGIDKKAAETLALGLVYEHTYRLVLKDGTVKWVWERCRTLEWNPDGTPRLLEGYVFDITDQRKLETAEMANRAKSEFLAVMSHEIRTPMNSIMGFAELARDSFIVPQIKDYLGKITDSTKWLLRIINDILDISKIESGKMELESVPFDLSEVFSRCQSVILPSIKEKGLDLEICAEPLPGQRLVGDPVRLYQVLMNLLSNAVKFTSAGAVKLSADLKDLGGDKAIVYFKVKDSGIGMSPWQIERIFDPFIQADSSTTRIYGGTGLGLAITKNIVELMGGKLAVESSPGAGSTFSFEVAFETTDAPDDMPDQAKFSILEKPHFEGLILICDDNSMNQEVVCEHLARVGLGTVTADNGKAGLDMVRERAEKNEKPFDLIFMDMFMPVMDGMEAASKITALGTGTPIVAMTANIMAGELEKYKKHGMPDCLGKPFTSQELWRVLLKYLTPVKSSVIEAWTPDNGELQKKLRINFVKNNQTIYVEITEAVAAGDLNLAHRLAHTLKGSAGLIGKAGLQQAAADVEALFRDGTISAWEYKMGLLKNELTLVLEEFRPLFDEAEAQKDFEPLKSGQVLALLEKLAPMLENLNPECMGLTGDIRAVPGGEKLARLIEDYDFESAAAALFDLKKQWM